MKPLVALLLLASVSIPAGAALEHGSANRHELDAALATTRGGRP